MRILHVISSHLITAHPTLQQQSKNRPSSRHETLAAAAAKLGFKMGSIPNHGERVWCVLVPPSLVSISPVPICFLCCPRLDSSTCGISLECVQGHMADTSTTARIGERKGGINRKGEEITVPPFGRFVILDQYDVYRLFVLSKNSPSARRNKRFRRHLRTQFYNGLCLHVHIDNQ
jgi:hypothetical protein